MLNAIKYFILINKFAMVYMVLLLTFKSLTFQIKPVLTSLFAR